MDDLALEQAEWTGKYMDSHVEKAMDWSVKTQGVEVVELDAAARSEWDGRLQFITDQWVTDAKAKGFPAQEIVDDIKMLTKKHKQ
jgi:hypothetical protein